MPSVIISQDLRDFIDSARFRSDAGKAETNNQVLHRLVGLPHDKPMIVVDVKPQPKPAGKPRGYPLETIEVGQTFAVERMLGRYRFVSMHPIVSCAKRYSANTGRQFVTMANDQHIRLTRVS
jgi:hypothetical protein